MPVKKKKSKDENGGPQVHCSYQKMVPVEKLKPNPQNPNTHPEAQIDKLASIIEAHGWRHPITVSNRSGCIVAGHCRLAAAVKLGLKKCPVDFQDFKSEAEEQAVLIADNKIGELSEIDGLAMADLLCELDQANYPLGLTAMDASEIEQYVDGPTNNSEPQDLARIGISCPNESSKALTDEIEPLLSKYEGAKFV